MRLIRNRNPFNPYRRVSHAGITVRRALSGEIQIGTADQPNSIGSFDDPVDAWKALDAIDLAEVESERAAGLAAACGRDLMAKRS